MHVIAKWFCKKRWERYHKKIHDQLLILFRLTGKQREKLRESWEPIVNEVVVCIYGNEFKNFPNIFDENGRFIGNDDVFIGGDYFPDYLFERTLQVKKIDGDRLYWFSDMFHYKHDCYPLYNKRKLYGMVMDELVGIGKYRREGRE